MFRRVESGVGRGLLYLLVYLLAVLIVSVLIGVANSNVIWGEDNQYGRVDIPGEKTLHLPQGDVQVAVAAALPGRGNETPTLLLPKQLSLAVASTDGGSEPKISDDLGPSVNANDNEVDTQRRAWKLDVPADGDYRVKATGDFTGYGVNAQLWLGYEPGFLHGSDIWLAGFAIVSLGIGIWWVILRFRKPSLP